MPEIGYEFEEKIPSYSLFERNGFYQVVSEHPNGVWEMSVVPRPHPFTNEPEKDAIEIYFRGIDESTHTITSRDIPGMNSTDKGFMEEFADRYVSRFQNLDTVKDSEDAFEKVFLDIAEYRENQWKKDREEWLKSWKSLNNSRPKS